MFALSLNSVYNHVLSLEFLGTCSGILSVFLLARGNFWGFIIGLVNAIAYIYIDLSKHIYGQSVVNLYYVLMNLLGIMRWTQKDANRRPKLAYSYTSRCEKLRASALFGAFILLSYGSYLIFAHFGLSQARTPLLDSLLTSLIFTAMYLSVHKKIEGWYLWFLVNISAMVLFYCNGLYLTILQYLVYLVIAIMGYFNWTHNHRQQSRNILNLT